MNKLHAEKMKKARYAALHLRLFIRSTSIEIGDIRVANLFYYPGDVGLVYLRGTKRDVMKVLKAVGSKARLRDRTSMNHGETWYRAEFRATPENYARAKVNVQRMDLREAR